MNVDVSPIIGVLHLVRFTFYGRSGILSSNKKQGSVRTVAVANCNQWDTVANKLKYNPNTTRGFFESLFNELFWKKPMSSFDSKTALYPFLPLLLSQNQTRHLLAIWLFFGHYLFAPLPFITMYKLLWPPIQHNAFDFACLPFHVEVLKLECNRLYNLQYF
jgi:hypothetical protein